MNILGILYAIFLHVLSFSYSDSTSTYEEGIVFPRYYHKNLLRYDYKHYDYRYYDYRQNQMRYFSFIQNSIIKVRKRGPFLQADFNCCRVSIDKKILLSSGIYLGSMLFIRRVNLVSIGIRLDARILYNKNVK